MLGKSKRFQMAFMTHTIFRSVVILCVVIGAAGGCSRSDNTEPAREDATTKQTEQAITAISEPSSSAHAPKDAPGKEDLKGLEDGEVELSMAVSPLLAASIRGLKPPNAASSK